VLDAYLRIIREGAEAPASVIAAQERVVVEEMRARRLSLMPELAALAGRQMRAVKLGRLPTPETAEREILAAASITPPAQPASPGGQRRP